MLQLVVVVGAGVIGLTTAIRCQRAGFKVVIVAKHIPGDKDIEYASCWAGAHHVSHASPETMNIHELEKETFFAMLQLMKDDPDVPLTLAPQLEYREAPRVAGPDKLSLISEYAPNFRMLEQHELPPGIAHGASFDTIMIDQPRYLTYLLQTFLSRSGSLHITSLTSLSSILSITLPPTSSSNLPSFSSQLPLSLPLSSTVGIINCSGLGALNLVGDLNVFPTRGQTVLIRAPWIKNGVTRVGKEGSGVYTYVIPRLGKSKDGKGEVILGGTSEANDWEAKPRWETSKIIKERTLALCPELLSESKRKGGTIYDLDVIEDGCGLRPTRKGGFRIELDALHVEGKTVPIHVVHNYGHGGYGFQASIASARKAVDLLNTALIPGLPLVPAKL